MIDSANLFQAPGFAVSFRHTNELGDETYGVRCFLFEGERWWSEGAWRALSDRIDLELDDPRMDSVGKPNRCVLIDLTRASRIPDGANELSVFERFLHAGLLVAIVVPPEVPAALFPIGMPVFTHRRSAVEYLYGRTPTVPPVAVATRKEGPSMPALSFRLKSWKPDGIGQGGLATYEFFHHTDGRKGTELAFEVDLRIVAELREEDKDQRVEATIRFQGCKADSPIHALDRLGGWLARAAEAVATSASPAVADGEVKTVVDAGSLPIGNRMRVERHES